MINLRLWLAGSGLKCAIESSGPRVLAQSDQVVKALAPPFKLDMANSKLWLQGSILIWPIGALTPRLNLQVIDLRFWL